MKKIAFHCECGYRIVVDDQCDEYATCPQCNSEVEVPGASRRVERKASGVDNSPGIGGAARRTATMAKATSGQRNMTSRRASRPAGPSHVVPMVVGGAVVVAVLIGVLIAVSGGGDDGGRKKKTKHNSADISDKMIRSYTNGLKSLQADYRRTWDIDFPQDTAADERTKIGGKIRESVGRHFSTYGAKRTRTDPIVNEELARWDVEEGGTPDKDPGGEPKGNGNGGDGPSLAEVRRFMGTLPDKAKYIEYIAKAANPDNEEAKRWFEGQAGTCKITVTNKCRIEFKEKTGVSMSTLRRLVDKVLAEWRGEATGGGTARKDPPPRDDPPPKEDDPGDKPLTARVGEFMRTQDTIKRSFLDLIDQHGWPVQPNKNQDCLNFHNNMMRVVRPQFPGASERQLMKAVSDQLWAWAREAGKG